MNLLSFATPIMYFHKGLKNFRLILQNIASVFEVWSLSAAALEKETSGCNSAEFYAFCNT